MVGGQPLSGSPGPPILVTGALGQLGGELLRLLQRRGEPAVGADLPDWDIAAEGTAAELVDRHRPRAVINCAAWTRVDDAEADPEAADRANALGPERLAVACRAREVPLLHLSTDFVFDGSARAPIPEQARAAPLGVYGRSKLSGEVAVRRLLPAHQIVRTSWLYGRSGPNFVLTMLRLARERASVRVVDDQVGSPTWTGHLAPALLRLLDTARWGTYHLSNAGEVSWCGFARAILAEAGLAAGVEAISSAEHPTAARRPAYSVLDNRSWRQLGETALPPWREGLRGYLAELRAAYFFEGW